MNLQLESLIRRYFISLFLQLTPVQSDQTMAESPIPLWDTWTARFLFV